MGVKTLLLGQRNAGGGSTITQQLAKQLYSPESHGLMSRVMQKPIEWMIAIKLERFYSKEEIIKMYLNQFDFLYNAVGIKSAAHVYFGKTPEELTVEEAATLVGMVKNPAYYNPVRRPERTMQRRNVVLDQMMRNGKLTAQQADSLKALPLKLDFHRVDHKNGLAPYFREELRRMLKAHRPVASDYPKWTVNASMTTLSHGRTILSTDGSTRIRNPTALNMTSTPMASRYTPPSTRGCKSMPKTPWKNI